MDLMLLAIYTVMPNVRSSAVFEAQSTPVIVGCPCVDIEMPRLSTPYKGPVSCGSPQTVGVKIDGCKRRRSSDVGPPLESSDTSTRL